MNLKKLLIPAIIFGLLAFGGWRLADALTDHYVPGDISGLGANNQAQLGQISRTDKLSKPKPLALSNYVSGEKFIQVKAGHAHTLMLTEDGKVYAMGGNANRTVKDAPLLAYEKPQPVSFSELKNGEKITQIDTSRDHNIALSSSGRVFVWGSNATGQLGNGTNNSNGLPQLVEKLPKSVAVAAGYRHSAAITESGEVYGWGGKCTDASYSAAQKILETAGSNIGALGSYGSIPHSEGEDNIEDCTTQDSTFVQSRTPVKLAGLKGKITAISIGYGHLLALNETGELFSGGCNTWSQLGRTKPPKGVKNRNDMGKVELPKPVTTITAGYRHSLVLLEDGEAYGWGYNGDGYALRVDSLEPTIKKPTPIMTKDRFSVIEAALDTSFAVTTKNKLVGWGQDDDMSFWQYGTIRGIHEFASLNKETLGLSAGRNHLLVLQKQT